MTRPRSGDSPPVCWSSPAFTAELTLAKSGSSLGVRADRVVLCLHDLIFHCQFPGPAQHWLYVSISNPQHTAPNQSTPLQPPSHSAAFDMFGLFLLFFICQKLKLKINISCSSRQARGAGGGRGGGGGGGGGGGVGGGQVGTMKCKNNCRLLISIVVWLILEMKKRREPDEIKISDSVILLLIIC